MRNRKEASYVIKTVDKALDLLKQINHLVNTFYE